VADPCEGSPSFVDNVLGQVALGNLPEAPGNLHCFSTDVENIFVHFETALTDEQQAVLSSAYDAWVVDDLQVLKDQRCREIDSRTLELVEAGFLHGGTTFGLSGSTFLDLLGLRAYASIFPGGFPLVWMPLDPSEGGISLPDSDSATSLANAGVEAYIGLVSSGNVLKGQVQDAGSFEAVDAVEDTR